MNRSSLYTRTGDKGTTSLVGGERAPKNSTRLEAYGTVDELNAHIGLLRAMMTKGEGSSTPEPSMLLEVQHRLFDIGAALATPAENEYYASLGVPIATDHISAMEHAIDRLDSSVPQLRSFILPGGSTAAAQAHVARTVCRRAERRVLALAEEAEVSPLIITYLNRLSDYLFILSRHINIISGDDEIIWTKNC